MSESNMSRLALGCYPLGGGYGGVDMAAATATVDAALSNGWTFLDTAEGYLDSEKRLGEILRGRRDSVFLATKVFPSEPYTYQNMRVSLDNSLRNLRTDRVDLFQLHGPQDWVISFDDALDMRQVGESLAQLVDDGGVVHVGVCNLPIDQMREISEAVDIFSTQNLYSLYDREGGDDDIHLPVGQAIIPWARERGIHVLAFSPLARGLLADGLSPDRTFAPDDERYFLPRFQPDVFPEWARLSNRLETWARDNGRTLVQLAVAWVLATPGVTSVLIGAKRPDQVEAFSEAEEWTLSEGDLHEIEVILGSLPEEAAAAKSIVWDHFPEDAVAAMAARRHGSDEESS